MHRREGPIEGGVGLHGRNIEALCYAHYPNLPVLLISLGGFVGDVTKIAKDIFSRGVCGSRPEGRFMACLDEGGKEGEWRGVE